MLFRALLHIQHKFRILLVLLVFGLTTNSSLGMNPSSTDSCGGHLSRSSRLSRQASISLYGLLKNISSSGTFPGIIVASPSRSNPDYFYDWVRDSALVWKTLLKLWRKGVLPEEIRNVFPSMAQDFIKAQRTMQANGPGEPKHLVDGSKFNGPWGRPQNDGPGLRMQVLVEMLTLGLLDERNSLFAKQIIETDRDYLMTALDLPDFEPWEEVQGFHFYNRLQIAHGAWMAMNYYKQASSAGSKMDFVSDLYEKLHVKAANLARLHLNDEKNLIIPSFRTGGLESKHTHLDITILLAHLHADFPEWWEIKAHDPKLLNSVTSLMRYFEVLYPINYKGLPGLMLGRYPEDIYDGNGFSGGNPWILSTLAVSEFFSLLSEQIIGQGFVEINELNLHSFEYIVKKYYPDFNLSLGKFSSSTTAVFGEFELIARSLEKFADDQMLRVLYHLPANGSMAEQINRETGFMQGAPDLSWSYGAYLRTYFRKH